MLTQRDQFIIELKMMIREDYERTRHNLSAGSAQNFEQYQKQVGKIQGLATALEYIDDAIAIVDGTKTRGE